jgi:hypothetical protein
MVVRAMVVRATGTISARCPPTRLTDKILTEG